MLVGNLGIYQELLPILLGNKIMEGSQEKKKTNNKSRKIKYKFLKMIKDNEIENII